MRPGQSSPGKLGGQKRMNLHLVSFNEAGAIKPRKTSKEGRKVD